MLVNGVVPIGRGQLAQLVEERKVLPGVLGGGIGEGIWEGIREGKGWGRERVRG